MPRTYAKLTFLAVWLNFATLLSAAELEMPSEAPWQARANVRRPVAAGLLDDGKALALANRRSGSVSIIDLERNRAAAEIKIGERLSSLAVMPGGAVCLVADESRGELIALEYRAGGIRALGRIETAPHPVGVVVSADGKRALVAGMWSRVLQVCDVSGLAKPGGALPPQSVRTVPLPFSPRHLLALPNSSSLVAADAFGGSLAIVDYEQGKLRAWGEIEGHNLRGLALSPDGKELLVAHQILDQKRPITEEAIEQGRLMLNVVRRVPLAEVLKSGPRSASGDGPPTAPVTLAGAVHRLDDGWIHGAADPAGLARTAAGEFAVALSGNNALAVLSPALNVERRINVGARPTAVLVEPRGGDLLVVNTNSDSVSRLDLSGARIPREISLGPVPKLAARERGELLFYDGSLSLHGWMTCHSCHADGHTNGLLADTSGDNSFGAPKRTLTLLGTALTDKWAWSGEIPYLHVQIRKSLDTTMHGPWASAENVQHLSDFLHSLAPPPPVQPVRKDDADRAQVARGRELFAERGCVRCHVPPITYTSFDTHDVGFSDELGRRKFNPPSLRGVSQGRRFFHDNRADSLEAVFREHGHGLEDTLSEKDLADLLRFLRSL